MATFEGNFKDFVNFIGPMSRNIVCNLARKHKTHTSCSHPAGCNKRTNLEAAHVHGKGRVEIMAKILESFQKGENLFKVDLEKFKEEFKNAHYPIEDVILPMCKKHHLEYDSIKKIKTEIPVLLNEFETEKEGKEIYSEEELSVFEHNEQELINESINLTSIKNKVADKLKIDKSQIAFSRISETKNEWNFDVPKVKFTKDFYFVFYNQKEETYKVAMIKANSINMKSFPEKNKDVIRFFVNLEFIDKTGFNFGQFLVD
jgi:hypothetical protein